MKKIYLIILVVSFTLGCQNSFDESKYPKELIDLLKKYGPPKTITSESSIKWKYEFIKEGNEHDYEYIFCKKCNTMSAYFRSIVPVNALKTGRGGAGTHNKKNCKPAHIPIDNLELAKQIYEKLKENQKVD